MPLTLVFLAFARPAPACLPPSALRAFFTAPRTPFSDAAAAAAAAVRSRRGAMVLGHRHDDMRRALLVTKRAAHRRGPQALPARAFVHETARNIQLIHIQRSAGIFGLALGIGDGAAQNFFDIPRGALLGVAQNLQGVLGALAADQVHHQADLLRRHAHMPQARACASMAGADGSVTFEDIFL